MKQYQGVAKIVTSKGTTQVESGIWESREKALAELKYFIGKNLPTGEGFKVVQMIKSI